ncbi:MAG: SUF system Fe-S cluster assembly regulator [Acidobacteriota bacterium]
MIRITRQTDYGIVLLNHLGMQPDRQFTAQELADETRLPAPMVSKILKTLSRAELLVSQRGVKGGYRVARPPEEISVVEVITAIEGPIGITECIDDAAGDCGIASFCQVRSNWQRINEVIRSALEAVTLAEMGRTPSPSALVNIERKTDGPITAGG